VHAVLTGSDPVINRVKLTALGLAVVLGVSACGATTPGAATIASESPSATVDVGQLNPGAYPTTAAAPMGNADGEQAGREVEGRRMAGYVVGPWQVDPALSRLTSGGPALMTDFKQLGAVVYATTMYQARAVSLIVGFSSERGVADPAEPTRLRNAVLRFPDPATATAVAQGLFDGAMNRLVMPDDSVDPVPAEPVRGIPVPGHPELSGVLFTFRVGDQTVREVSAFSAQGPFVLIQTARAAQGPERAAELVGRALDLQVPLIDRFQPTDAAQIASLPLDPTGLAARTLAPKADPAPQRNGVYDAAGALHLEADPVQVGQALSDAGVDEVAARLTTVYQARDAEQARRLSGSLADTAANSPASKPGAPVPGLPRSRCVLTDDTGGLLPRQRCFASVGRYAFGADSAQTETAYQQMAAQYRILADS
jgi:hypothetical protein